MNCIIIHGCGNDPKDTSVNQHWIPWTIRQLRKHGIKVYAPKMPKSWDPDYERYKKKFAKYTVTKNTILIGHSCGCAFLVRWLGESGKKTEKLILIAPWKIPSNKRPNVQDFYGFSINKNINKQVRRIIMFTSDNESEIGKISLKKYQQFLKAEIVNLPNHGHYIFSHMKTKKFPELLEKIV